MHRASSWMDPRPKVSEKIQIMSSTKYHGPRMASLSFLHGSMLLYFNLYYTSTYLLSKLISQKESFNLFYEMLLIPPRCYRFTPKIQDEEALQTLAVEFSTQYIGRANSTLFRLCCSTLTFQNVKFYILKCKNFFA